MHPRPTPPDKKRLRDRRDHIADAEYPHGLRNHWSTKEARTHRAFRHAQRQRIGTLLVRDIESDSIDDVTRKIVRKWGATPLGESVKGRLALRTARAAHNLFKRPYHRSQHERAARFFATMLAERSAVADEIRACVRAALTSPAPTVEPAFSRLHNATSLRAWLDRFFCNDPTWAPRLRAWSR